MSTFFNGWYLLYTKPNSERKISTQLTEQSIKNYSPTTRILKRWCDRKKVIHKPLFPSYVFVYLENIQDYYNSLQNPGVVGYVRFGKQLARVPDITVNNIQIVSSQHLEVETSRLSFPKGQEVVITEGPLFGLKGEVIQHRGGEKILIRLSVLQQCVLANVHPDHLMVSDNRPMLVETENVY